MPTSSRTSLPRPTHADQAHANSDISDRLDGTLRGHPDRPGRAAYGQRPHVTGTNPDLRYLPAGRDPWDTTRDLDHRTRQGQR
jgi:hypothetical protein